MKAARRLPEWSGRPSAYDEFTDKSEEHRQRAESLVRGIEVLMRKFTDLQVVPLDVLDRYERAIVKAHTDNLLRLPKYHGLDDDER